MVESVGKYQRYAEYKDSGVEWLGEIPSHWNRITFNRIVIQVKDGTHGTHVRTDDGPVLLSAKNVFNNGIKIGSTESRILIKDFNEIVSNGFPKKGDILVTCVGTIGRSCVYPFDEPMAFQRSVAFLRLNSSSNPIYYKYFIESKQYQSQLESLIKSSAQGGVYMGDLISTVVSSCAFNEQTQIANFLDHETTKIDSLIEKQKQLIQLLKEKRQAVISHAVTKGLDPSVKMKDSGVEWLGEVPEHWRVIKGGYIGRLFGSESIAEDDVVIDGELPFIKVSSLSSSNFELKKVEWFVSDKKARLCKPEKNYIVFPKRGAAIFTNKVNVVKVDSVIDPNLMGWKVEGTALAEYVALLLKTRKLDDIADVSTVPQINNKHISPEKFPIPPLNEQKTILDYLNVKLERFKDLIQRTELSIQFSKERRTALISAAVTGKIDVRNWQNPIDARTELSA